MYLSGPNMSSHTGVLPVVKELNNNSVILICLRKYTFASYLLITEFQLKKTCLQNFLKTLFRVMTMTSECTEEVS